MNVYTVTKATQGLANYIKKQGGEDKGVAIAFDSRHMSVEFSEKAALCLNANGIKTYRFETLRPTPELSFALRELHCIAGIVVTASHNPPEYNGYKVYWEDGAQITAPKDKEIIAEVNAVTDFASIKMMDRAEAEEKGLFHVIGKEIDDRYMEELKKLVLSPDVIKEMADSLKIVYTPLHGTGNLPVPVSYTHLLALLHILYSNSVLPCSCKVSTTFFTSCTRSLLHTKTASSVSTTTRLSTPMVAIIFPVEKEIVFVVSMFT